MIYDVTIENVGRGLGAPTNPGSWLLSGANAATPEEAVQKVVAWWIGGSRGLFPGQSVGVQLGPDGTGTVTLSPGGATALVRSVKPHTP